MEGFASRTVNGEQTFETPVPDGSLSATVLLDRADLTGSETPDAQINIDTWLTVDGKEWVYSGGSGHADGVVVKDEKAVPTCGLSLGFNAPTKNCALRVVVTSKRPMKTALTVTFA